MTGPYRPVIRPPPPAPASSARRVGRRSTPGAASHTTDLRIVLVGMGSARREPVRSRRGGLATALGAPANDLIGQLALDVLGREPRMRSEPLPDVVHVPDWLDGNEQGRLVEDFERWARPPAGLRHPRMPTGHLMSVQSVCLGWHWQPYAYSTTADDTDGAPVKPLPDGLVALARRAVHDTLGSDLASSFAPDAAIVNFYGPGAR